MEMHKEMTTKILSQFLIGNVYQSYLPPEYQKWVKCQFLIGNVYQQKTAMKE